MEKSTKKDARQVALNALYACEKQGAWSDGFLKHEFHRAGLEKRDAGLATQLCAGVLQNKMLLDYYIGHFSSVKLERMEPNVLCILRMGAYQLLMLDRIPASAAVNTAVELARRASRNPRTPGLVNGILRSIERHKNSLPSLLKGSDTERLSIQYSHPKWLVEEFLAELGTDEAELLLQCHNQRPHSTAQVNSLCTTATELKASLLTEGVHAELHPWLYDCLTLSRTGDMERLTAWQNGSFYIQDTAAKLAVIAVGLQPEMTVLDACAAPGGKSFAAAIAMQDRGVIYSCDLHPHKIKLIEAGAARLKLSSITAQQQSATQFRDDWKDRFDVVLADVPCSGLGVIRKKPDIRYKDREPLKNLPKVQLGILENVARYVKPGGVLLYSTCTVLKRENEGVVSVFLRNNQAFSLEAFSLPGPVERVESGQITLWPHRHVTDGFFIAKLRKAVADS